MSDRAGATLARRAIASDQEQSAPVSLDTMLGNGPVITLQGCPIRLYPIALKDHSKLHEALGVLGENYVLPALAEDNATGMSRMMKLMDADSPDLRPEDVDTALRLAAASHTTEHIDAMLDICEIAFNPPRNEGMRKVFEAAGLPWEESEPLFTREMVAAVVSVRAFPAILRAIMDASGLNPTAPQ